MHGRIKSRGIEAAIRSDNAAGKTGWLPEQIAMVAIISATLEEFCCC